ncbi:C2H2-type zinc finger protein, partial [Sansalvadorimonas verongulae]|nr:C2H2-type zinc finger protein [Sansalvadorimonas verongulae]
HTGYKPFVCDQNGCKQSFTQPGALTRHKRTHTGDRPYVCNKDGCNKRFSLSSHLTRHQLKHRNVRGRSDPVCPF